MEHDGSPTPSSPVHEAPDTPHKAEESPVKAPRKRQLSAAQQEALAKAREKARQTKLAKSEAKKKEQADFDKWKSASEPVHQESDPEDDNMSPSPSPPPRKKALKKKAFKKPAPKRRREASSSDSASDSDDAPPRNAAEDHLRTVKAAYDVNMARYKNDVMYRSLFPYL